MGMTPTLEQHLDDRNLCTGSSLSNHGHHDWEKYCSNATILRAMAAVPWFGKVGSG